jgi:glycosyltransferase involved in cell wall biosynthesis
MIVRDEVETIGRCLETVKEIVDEIIIVDTGSADGTKDIIKQYTKDVFDYKWMDDFSDARNYSFSKATKEYILWMDADDIFEEKDREKMLILKEKLDDSIDIVMMKYNLVTKEEDGVAVSYDRERLYKRIKNFKWQDAVHEFIVPAGRILKTDIAITHKKMKKRTTRNLEIFQKIIKEGKILSHRNLFYYGRELYANNYIDEAKTYYEKYLNQGGGCFSNYMDACIHLSKIYTKSDNRKMAIETLLRCFEFGMPRAEICFELGSQYKALEAFKEAIKWFELATKIKEPDYIMGEIIHDYYHYFPLMEMSICYFRLGKIDKAMFYNELAAKDKPMSQAVINNRKYFEICTRNKDIQSYCKSEYINDNPVIEFNNDSNTI